VNVPDGTYWNASVVPPGNVGRGEQNRWLVFVGHHSRDEH
jgi:hypothetical protein